MQRLWQSIIGRREIFTTFEPEKLSKILYILQTNGIKYYLDSKHTGSGSHKGGMWRAYGEQVQYETQYYVYVKKDIFEEVQNIIRENYRG